MATFLIEVTQEDIDRGNPGMSMSCPIARAITRKTGLDVAVASDMIYTQPYSPEQQLVARQPYIAQDFVEAFDEHRGGKPFAFWLTLKEEEHD